MERLKQVREDIECRGRCDSGCHSLSNGLKSIFVVENGWLALAKLLQELHKHPQRFVVAHFNGFGGWLLLCVDLKELLDFGTGFDFGCDLLQSLLQELRKVAITAHFLLRLLEIVLAAVLVQQDVGVDIIPAAFLKELIYVCRIRTAFACNAVNIVACKHSANHVPRSGWFVQRQNIQVCACSCQVVPVPWLDLDSFEQLIKQVPEMLAISCIGLIGAGPLHG